MDIKKKIIIKIIHNKYNFINLIFSKIWVKPIIRVIEKTYTKITLIILSRTELSIKLSNAIF